MSILYDNLIVAELSCVFTYLMYTLANPKYSLKTHVLIHFLTTVAFLAVKNLVNGAALQYGMETVLWMLLGCLLISPLLVFYGGNWILRFSVFFYILCYLLSIFSVANRAAYLITNVSMSNFTLLFQTLLYIGSLKAFKRFSEKKFVKFLSETEEAAHMWLLLTQTATSFILIVAYNVLLINVISEFEKLLLLLLLMLYMIQTNILLVYYLQTDKNKQKFQLMAVTDPLTKLGNSVALAEKFHAMQQEGGKLFLLFLDLDDFKNVNDTFGHKTGDLYLIHFAQALERLCDDQTFFFRKSGDEFICLSRNAELSHQLRTLQPKTDPGIFFQGFSFGCAQMPEDGVTLAELMDAADRNMYVHKQNRHHFSFGGKSSVGR